MGVHVSTNNVDEACVNFCIDEIKEKGFVILRKVISAELVNEILNFIRCFKYSEDDEIAIKNKGMRLNNFADNIFNVVTKRPDFLNVFIRGIIGSVLKELLNDQYYTSIPPELPNYILRNILARSSKEAMPYHIDNFIPYEGSLVSVMQVSIFLEKSNQDRGCTKVIPGSHLSGKYAPQSGYTPVFVEAEPGDVAMWDSRLWHATSSNVTSYSRWALIATFCRWYIKQGYDYPRAIPKEVFESLPLENKIVLGYASSVPLNEFEKTEVKGGIGNLK